MAQRTKHTARTRARKSTGGIAPQKTKHHATTMAVRTLTLIILSVGLLFLLLQQRVWHFSRSGNAFHDVTTYRQAWIIDVPSVSTSSGTAVVKTRKNMDDHKDTTMAPGTGTGTGTELPPIPNNTIQTPVPATTLATAATHCVHKRITTAQQHW